MSGFARKGRKAKKKQEFEVEFINDNRDKGDLQTIMQREFVRFANEEKGFTFLTLKNKD